jgi:chromosome segregation ATPase
MATREEAKAFLASLDESIRAGRALLAEIDPEIESMKKLISAQRTALSRTEATVEKICTQRAQYEVQQKDLEKRRAEMAAELAALGDD